jgi:lipoprotein-anchoring transpeptidase ErfK/SrfK
MPSTVGLSFSRAITRLGGSALVFSMGWSVAVKAIFGAFLLSAVAASGLVAVDAAHASGAVVTMRDAAAPGTIIVRTKERRLYLVTAPGQAISYPVGVGRVGKQWSGTSYINGKYTHPAWSPPADVRRDKPNLPEMIPGGSPSNPMGVAAMTLAGGEYAIHGTNQPGSIGHFVSYGCIRMHNEDIQDLYGRVGVGTRVVVQ